MCEGMIVPSSFFSDPLPQGKIQRDGDIDVAAYFQPEKGVEWENVNKRYAGENRIAPDLERLLKKEIDLVVLSRARVIVADETTVDLPWSAFKGKAGESGNPYPFDGLILEGDRPDGSPIFVNAIELY